MTDTYHCERQVCELRLAEEPAVASLHKGSSTSESRAGKRGRQLELKISWALWHSDSSFIEVYCHRTP